MSLSLVENVIVAEADNRPPMLDKTNYSSWASQPGNENTPATVRARTYADLTDEEKIRESVDIKATNIVFKRESKLYDDFNTFTSIPGETIHLYYMRFAQLINDMHTIGMTMKPLQVNTKFVNHLQPEWSKFVTDVKLAKDMHTTNFDHLYAYLRQHEAHANEVRLARQMYQDQIALVSNSPSCLNPTHYYPQLSSASQQYYLSPAPQRSYDALIVQQSQYLPQVVTPSLAIHQQPCQAPALQQSYQAPAIPQPSSIEWDSGLVVPSFNPSDDLIANLNKLMAFCTKLKKPKNPTWFKEKMLLTEDLESGAYLDPELLAFLSDNRDTIILAQASQEIPTPTAFQTDDLDAFDSDCDDVPSAKAVLMANLSSYDSDVLSEVPFHDTNIENDMSYQSVQETQCSEQLFVDDDTEMEITSDSNIISYEQYLQETKNLVIQNTSSSPQQDELLMSVIEEMSSQVAKCNKVQQENLIVHETLTVELERYKKTSKNL
ncbi:hypothetical protein Tco_0205948 [Tanacetum coccineum]